MNTSGIKKTLMEVRAIAPNPSGHLIKIGSKPTEGNKTLLTKRVSTMGNGLYGENQGNESRVAERHGQAVVAQEALESHLSVSSGVGKEIADMAAHYNLGAWDSLEDLANKLVATWGSDFLAPPRERGESDKHYEKRLEKVAKEHYHRVVRKIQGMLSSAMRGNAAILNAEGVHLNNDGARIKARPGLPAVNPNGEKKDWTLPVGAY